MHMNITLGSYPGLNHLAAIEAALSDSSVPVAKDHIQLCPQNHGLITAETLAALKAVSPDSKFRFHANARVDDRVRLAEASTPWAVSKCYFETLAGLNAGLDRQPYSIHAGERTEATLGEMSANIRRIEDLMQVRVAVEGLYPVAGSKYLIDSWAEYRWLLMSGLDFALDLSHVNIVAHRTRTLEETLVKELLASEHCIEVHLSANDGHSDLHSKFDPNYRTWWHDLLGGVNPGAVAFYEGNEVRKPVNSEVVAKKVADSARRERLLARV